MTDAHRRRLLAAGLLAATGGVAPPAAAQIAWPARTVRIVVPVPAGSFTDLAARALAAELAQRLGRPFAVANRVGAGGTAAADAVAKAAPDGHALLLTDIDFAMAPALRADLPYDPLRDLAPVTILALVPATWSVRADLPARTLGELLEQARAKPGALAYGSSGVGSSSHLATELFLASQAAKMRHVPSKGATGALGDAAAGRVDLAVSSIATSLPLIKAGKLRALAITSEGRHPSLPDVPSFAELGFSGYDMQYWFALATTGRTPPAIVARLQQEVARALEAPRMRQVFALQGAMVVGSTPADARRRIEREIAGWREVAARAGIKPR